MQLSTRRRLKKVKKIFGGAQDFAKLRRPGYFYVGKTSFIREWWKGSGRTEDVTLITRPRRFGKVLMMSTLKYFFSLEYAGRSESADMGLLWKKYAKHT